MNPYQSPVASFSDTTKPPGEIEFARFWRRLLAFLIDWSLVLGLVFLAGKLLPMSYGVRLVLSTLSPLLSTAYFLVPNSTKGQTLGKRLMRIKVCCIDKQPLDLTVGLFRTTPVLIYEVIQLKLGLGWVMARGEFGFAHPDYIQVYQTGAAYTGILFLVLLVCLFGEVVSVLASKKHQALHDMIPETIVVKLADSIN